MSFLPQGYEKPQTSNASYFKFKDGDNRFRILSNATLGYIYWNNENKPVRSKEAPQQMINAKVNPVTGKEQPAKHFWTFVVFDYSDTTIKIMEVTQKNIQIEIYNFHMDEAWGDPKQYDINIKKTGQGIETKYSVMPSPPSELNPQVKDEYESMNINLEALFTNGDPFGGNNESQVATQPETINIEEPPIPQAPNL